MGRRSIPFGLLAIGAVVLASRAWSADGLGRSVAAEATLFVAPGGSDDWSGRRATPAADGSDGPLATVAKAVERSRQDGNEHSRRLEAKTDQEELTTLSYRPEDLGAGLDVQNAELTIYHMWDESVGQRGKHHAGRLPARRAPTPPGQFRMAARRPRVDRLRKWPRAVWSDQSGSPAAAAGTRRQHGRSTGNDALTRHGKICPPWSDRGGT